jgi:hypothetical protein
MGEVQGFGRCAQTPQPCHGDERSQGGQRWNALGHVKKIEICGE